VKIVVATGNQWSTDLAEFEPEWVWDMLTWPPLIEAIERGGLVDQAILSLREHLGIPEDSWVMTPPFSPLKVVEVNEPFLVMPHTDSSGEYLITQGDLMVPHDRR